MEELSFLTEDQVRAIQAQFGTPVYVYDQETLEKQAKTVVTMPNAYGLTARYAMKALPNASIIRVLTAMGLHIDASSAFEAERAMKAGVPPSRIQLTAQQLPESLRGLVEKGVLFNACSIHQLDTYGRMFPGAEACIRVNPGLGSGHSNRTNVGGPSSSFGIWHEHLDQVFATLKKHGLRLTRMHSHIGSGADPETWHRCARMSLDIAAKLPDVHTLSLGGGYKVGRMKGEASTDLHVIGRVIVQDFEDFYRTHGRKLHLEIEPGTYLVANAGAIVTTIIDVTETGADGYSFIKIDSGMTEVVRPAMYGAQHPIVVVPKTVEARGTKEYLVAGHCCESGDILTPERDNPEGLQPRQSTEAKIGDAPVIGGAGAYCAGMSSKNYNSFPEAPEVLLSRDGKLTLIRKRQTLEQIVQNEAAG
ncbi:MAG: diaminopimelate decarboxylase [Candidatus Hydrogenedentes bacterium]|nr:diaminopimelate decarboxylase [Candidatus Hydrogenedentota bacterium]